MYIKKDILGNTVSTIQTLVMKVIMMYIFKYTLILHDFKVLKLQSIKYMYK